MWALAAPAARAQAPELPVLFSKLRPKVGSWAEYRVTSARRGSLTSPGTLRVAVVGKKGKAVWLEERMTPSGGAEDSAAVVKMLVGPRGAVLKVYVLAAGAVIDATETASGVKKARASASKAKLKKGRKATVSVPAGKFQTTRFSFRNGSSSGSTWVKPGVGPFGLVKQVLSDPQGRDTLELLASGSGAVSEVDESRAQSLPAP